MKAKHHFHHMQFVLLGMPFLLLSPATQGQETNQDVQAAEVTETAETAETAEEKAKVRRDKETAAQEEVRRRPQADKTKKAVQEEGNTRVPEKDPKVTPPGAADMPEETGKPAADRPETPSRGQGRKDTAPGARERTERRVAPEPREGRDRKDRPATPTEPPLPVDETKPPVDMPVVPSAPIKPGEEVKPRSNERVPDKGEVPGSASDQPAGPDTAEIPASEPERQAETKVTEVTREVQRDLDKRKAKIEDPKEAKAVIEEILGAKSRISQAEVAREERYRTRIERQRTGDDRATKVSPEQRRAATTYFQQRLRGREVEGPPPEFFRRSARGDRRNDRVVERVEFVRPRYLNEGRRYVHYDSRASIPAILMAAQAMNQVRFQSTREVSTIFHDRQDVSAMPLPPENYRSEESLVVSYPVDESSMISSEDILFIQGSTQFADPYSYEVIAIMADAMKELPEEERFVVEGHASAEGSYDSNMVLSQQRAEHIVREIVRRGVSPYRLLPVGYGESEARNKEDAAEALRSQDRRVVVFRMKPEPIAKR